MSGELCGFDKEPCIEHKCRHYKMVIGEHPQTGETLHEYDCVFNLGLLQGLEQNKLLNRLSEFIHEFRKEAHQDSKERKKQHDEAFSAALLLNNSSRPGVRNHGQPRRPGLLGRIGIGGGRS